MNLYIFYIFLICSVSANPLIVYKWKNQCGYETGEKNKKIFFNDEVITLKSRPFILHFNLCGNVSAEYKGCSGHKSVCLLENEKEIDVGNLFNHDEEGTYFLKTNPGSSKDKTCYGNDVTSIGLSLVDSLRKPKLVPTDNDCVYEILYPNPKITPKCAARVGVGEMVNVESLKTSISVTTPENRRFHFTLCGSDPNCDVGVSACEILENGNKVNLAEISSQGVSYLDNNKELSVRGSFDPQVGGRRNRKIRFDAVLICNWTVEGVDNAFYNLRTPQAKKYPFKMQSNFACIKFPLNCVIYDHSYTYNMTGFYNHLGYTKVLNTTNDMFINVCGPLNLTSSSNLCSETSAQVCEVVNNEYINHGSIYNDFQIVDNKLELEIQSGITCKENNTLFYTTKVSFECSAKDEGPILNKIDNCVSYLSWKSPKACPYQEKSRCHARVLDNNDCVFKFDDVTLNLSPLSRDSGNSYVVNDPNDPNIEYLFNICSGVKIDEAPCVSNSMLVVRNLGEKHLIKRIISFGSSYWTEKIDNNLQLTLSGGYQSDFYIMCEAKIIFSCSNEEQIILMEKNECNYKFMWNTKHACSESVDPCKLKLLDKEVDFQKLKKRTYKVASIDGQKNYTFDICNRKYELCEKSGICKNHLFENKTFRLIENIPQMELILTNNTICSTKQEFNRVYINFNCIDPSITDNDHIMKFNIKDCDIYMAIATNLLCSFEKPLEAKTFQKTITRIVEDNETLPLQTKTVKKAIPTIDEDNETFSNPVKSQIYNLNCNLFNETTGASLNISDLRPFKVPFSEKCPSVIYNRPNKSIILNYSTGVPCMEKLNYSYKILLNCSKETVPLATTKLSKCSEHLYKADSNVCSLFQELIFDRKAAGLPMVAIICSIIVIIIIVAFISFIIFKNRMYQFYDRLRPGYHKNGDQ